MVVNPANATGDFSYEISVVPYNVSGEDYAVDTSQISTYSQIANWITISEPTGTLAPNETKTIDFTIKVPESAPGGGQSAALIVSPSNAQSSGSGVSIEQVFQIASIVYANVSGETVESGEILENSIPYFAFSTPVAATALFTNTGNVYETALVKITATNAITHEQILPAEGESGTFAEIVLPETTRLISRNLSNLPAVGIVQVEQSIDYQGQTSITSHSLLILPIWFIILVLAVIAAAITGIVFAVRHHRRKNVF